MKVACLVLHTDFIGEICDGDVHDGKLLVKKNKTVKEFVLSVPKTDDDGKTRWKDVKPFSLVRGKFGGVKPLYIVKWNSLYPVAFEVREGVKKYVDPSTQEEIDISFQNLEVVKPEFKDTKILPELLGETTDLRFMKGMKKYSVEGDSPMRGIFLFAGIFLLLAGAGYLIYYFLFSGA
jgi:hypothetical protein